MATCHTLVSVTVSAVLLLASGLAPAVGKDLERTEADRVIDFKSVDGGALKLHVFLPMGWKAEDRRPAALFFFGGGWVSGKPEQFFPQAAYLATRGLVGISAQYRTKGSHGTSPKECVEDGKSAVRWVRGHAGELGIDPDRIAVGGGSAGGHVAAASTFCPGFDAEGEDLKISTRANALLLYNPVFDNGLDGGWNHKTVKDYWKLISPAENISKPVPPMAVFLGSNDKLIPVSTAERFKKKVEMLGGRCDLHLYPGAEHGFFNNEPYFSKALGESDAFLVSLGWLEKKE